MNNFEMFELRIRFVSDAGLYRNQSDSFNDLPRNIYLYFQLLRIHIILKIDIQILDKL